MKYEERYAGRHDELQMACHGCDRRGALDLDLGFSANSKQC
ncbi:hypothetical protein ACFPOD_07880 [Nitratireductor kimnyeongensis]|uniref:Uncharacterized protein n=1 Tax=Nitratireductor kimnyeongensis TaxID=430679 RepID=A0ABW0T6M6_9HYPH|nr:hypothetical protein [Nitratireductor kimnyeongensis]